MKLFTNILTASVPLLIASALTLLVAGFSQRDESNCPPYEFCNDCGVDGWIRPVFTQTSTLFQPDECDVRIEWVWPYDDIPNANPLMVFVCYYTDDGTYCNQGYEDQCASCEFIDLYSVRPSKTPFVNFTDTCGNSERFSIAEDCSSVTATTTTTTLKTTTTPNATTLYSEPTSPPEGSTSITTAAPDTTVTSTPGEVMDSTTVGGSTSGGGTGSTAGGTITPGEGTESTTAGGPTSGGETDSTAGGTITPAGGTDTSTVGGPTSEGETDSTTDGSITPGQGTESTTAGGPTSGGETDSTTDGGITPGVGTDSTTVGGSTSGGVTDSTAGGTITPGEGTDTSTVGELTSEGATDLTTDGSVTPGEGTASTTAGGPTSGGETDLTTDGGITPGEVTGTTTAGGQTTLTETSTTESPCLSSDFCTACDTSINEWSEPMIYHRGITVDEDLCNVVLTWEADLEAPFDPRLTFSCIYAATGGYCNETATIRCASCETATIYDIRPSLRPFIQYGDNCGFADDFWIAQDCGTLESTTGGPIDCPSPDTCEGCPDGLPSPSFSITGVVVDGSCDVTISWTWSVQPPYSENPRMTFQCVYETTGRYCEDTIEMACGTCGQVVFHDVDEEEDPVINFSTTCGEIGRLQIGSVCQNPGSSNVTIYKSNYFD